MTMKRVYNFSAGPSMMPMEVLCCAQSELCNFSSSGMSVMEMSHRSSVYQAIIDEAEANLRALMHIPDNYHVLFLQGGASLQFAMVALNLFSKENGTADYIHTGMWTKKAIAEAKKYGNVNVIATSENENFACIPQWDNAKFNKDADYCYICLNNTIYGTRYTDLPDTGNVPLVADISSIILSQEIDVTKFGILFAGAQKNIGPAGLTVVIIRDDLVGKALDITPTMLDYKTHVDGGSMYNTPPTFAIYMAGLTFKWLLDMGGVAAMQKINEQKAKLMYDFLDNSKYFKGTVVKKDRSLMNIPFVLPTEQLNKQFIKQAEEKGFVNLKGHRSVGGMRASIYNAMPLEGVQKLVEFMAEFEKQIEENYGNTDTE